MEKEDPTVLPASDKTEIKAQKIQTEALYARRKKIHPRSVKGVFASWRWILVWVTQLVFYGAPWLHWNDRQAVLFHLAERKFYIFGLVFWPQDVFFLALLLIISALALFLFTTIAGRLWCGYACPQTVYTEIFLWFEEKIEGDRLRRIRLDAAPLSGRKIAIKSLKYFVWGAFSLWTGFTFVSYFTPVKELLTEVASFQLSGWETFWVLFYSGFTYLFAGVMREQVCKYMCPYARFQSVMFDADTMVITYDKTRGEPRGARKKNADPASLGKGDCVDCGICVQVCPTGIDIRNGLQYECIGCAACIDACDEVMVKMNYPKGLIRYTTENAMSKRWGRQEILKHIRRPRTLGYSAVLSIVCLGFAAGLFFRVPLSVDVIRDRSAFSREAEDGRIENSFRLEIMNKHEHAREFSLQVSGLEGIEIVGTQKVKVESAYNHSVAIQVRVAPSVKPKGSYPVTFKVTALDDPSVVRQTDSKFIISD